MELDHGATHLDGQGIRSVTKRDLDRGSRHHQCPELGLRVLNIELAFLVEHISMRPRHADISDADIAIMGAPNQHFALICIDYVHS